MRFLLLGISVFVLHATTQPVFAEADPSEQLKSLQERIQDFQKKIDKNKAQRKTTYQSLTRLRSQIHKEAQQLKTQIRKESQVKSEIQRAEGEQRSLESKLNMQYSNLSQKIRAMFMTDQYSFLEYLLVPADYSHAVNIPYFFKRLSQQDAAAIQEIQATQIEIRKQKESLAVQQRQYQTLQKKIRSDQRQLKSKETKLNKTLSQLQKELTWYQEKQAALHDDSIAIEKMIRAESGVEGMYFAVGHFIKSVKGWISSNYGYRTHPIFKRRKLHNGIDFAAARGTEIRASNAGYISFAGWKKGYGNTTIINHGYKQGKQISSVYAHQHRLLVKKGSFVKKGQLIGYVGSTGYSTGPHLHFEIRENGKAVNPRNYLQL